MIDYDYEWKLLLERLFEEAILFYMPELHALIDFSIDPVFLEKEFQTLLKERLKDKKKSVDKLARVQLKDGSEKWILIHIEVQSYFEKNFAMRMFIYYYLILEKYGEVDLTALAIYTGDRIPKQYNAYKRSFFGTELSFKFNSYKVRDQKEEDLLASKNPFALAVLASLYLLKSKKDVNLRYSYKRNLVELAIDRGLNRKEIRALFRFIRYIVELPPDLNQDFDKQVSAHLNQKRMTIPTEQDREFVSMIHEAYFGESMFAYFERLFKKERQELASKAEQAKAKAEAEKQKAEQAKAKAEAEKQKAEQAKAKAEAEKQKAEQAKAKAEAERIQKEEEHQLRITMVETLIRKNVFSLEEIADMAKMTLDEVHTIKKSITG